MASIDEYKKFVASAPEGEREFRTVEIYHPDFPATLRFVSDFVDQQLTLEATAPRDAGQTVTFTAIAMKITEPAESGDVEQVLTVDLGAVGNEVNDNLALINDTLTPVDLIYRKYYSGDKTEPVLVLTLAVSSVAFKGYEAVSLAAEDVNFAIKRAGELYTIERFPGLRLL